ncbi:MAG: FAD-binding oxidoreductase [bacterium]|jgi:alkyldihydroxyacetonephosphate synthase|nr:FAD-binding oxidoreductase [Gammaproteobacteria bacterium]HIL83765.1 FAD-binding oxidoreductase [Pseudomonadales bacterium]
MSEQRGRRSFWTWGWQSDEPSQAEREEMAQQLSANYGREVKAPPIPLIDDIELRDPRLKVPDTLAEIVTCDKTERIIHTYGGHFLELNRALKGDFAEPPDAVAYPANETELESVLDWCDSHSFAVIPYGGGTTVVNGVSIPATVSGAVTIDLERLNQVLEVDEISLAARIQAGIFGPDLESALRPQGFTLRHFPQSFPWSTLGGWIVTRSGGHYATNHTHIDDFVESMRMLTPSGWWESRRLPGSGAGPSPDRMIMGSEGTLGIVTEAWMRIQRRPTFRASAGVLFPSFESAYTACRHIAQAKLWPANLRLLDPSEASRAAGLDGKQALLIIGFESAEVPQGNFIQEAVKIAREYQGLIADEDIRTSDGSGETTGREGAVGNWRSSFIGVNAGLTNGLGVVGDTFETAITWDRWPEFDAVVREEVTKVLNEVFNGAGTLSCRFTHVYTDGPAPYYTFSGLSTPGGEAEQWQAIKDAASEAVIKAGGTITHHHSVGRMHRKGWSEQRPALFEAALKGAKKQLDPNGILNPGVLFDS